MLRKVILDKIIIMKKIVFLVFIIPLFCFSQNKTGILKSNANVRWGPGTNNKIIKQFPKGKQIVIIEAKGNWYLISDPVNNKRGWISKSIISLIPSGKTGNYLEERLYIFWKQKGIGL